jgi:hypothetical protein
MDVQFLIPIYRTGRNLYRRIAASPAISRSSAHILSWRFADIGFNSRH